MRRKRPLIGIGGVAVVGLALAAAFDLPPFGRGDDEGGIFASGTVEATDAQIGFEIAGKVDQVFAREGDAVGAGVLVASLDASDARARHAQAEAALAAARAMLIELEAGSRPEEIVQAKAAFEAAQQKLEDADRDLRRARALFEAAAVSEATYDKAQTAHAVAGSQAAHAREQLRLVQAGPRVERIRAQRALVTQAEAALRSAQEALDRCDIRTPFAGVVTVKHREPGEVVPPGAAVLTLMNPGDRWVRIYIPEDRIGAVQLGASASISSDTYPKRRYAGEVMFISPEAEFTPKNVQTAEERVRLVYAVKVRITADSDNELKPGMPADVRIELRES